MNPKLKSQVIREMCPEFAIENIIFNRSGFLNVVVIVDGEFVTLYGKAHYTRLREKK